MIQFTFFFATADEAEAAADAFMRSKIAKPDPKRPAEPDLQEVAS